MNRIIPFVIICALLNISAYADGTHPQGIRLDGTVGTAGKIELPGPNYAIKPEYGKQSGSNLFHSFQQFNIHNGESATFSGPASVQNIISRVTGGSASWIDGRLASTIPGADLYFLNPAGVMFGSNAALDLSGSFHVSTADYLRMGENERFYSKPIENEVLSVAPPSAFGFLSDKPGKISLDGAKLKVSEEKDISLIGGDIEIRKGTVKAQSGRINMAGVSSYGEIVPTEAGLEASAQQKGTITISDYSEIDVRNGGSAFIRGGQIVIQKDSKINAETGGNKNGGIADIRGDSLTISNRSYISAGTSGAGKAGNIDVESGNLQLTDSSQIGSSTSGIGEGGTIIIRAKESFSASGYNSGVFANSNSTKSDAGKAGNIDIQAGQVQLKDSAQINSLTRGTGAGGTVRIRAGESFEASGYVTNEKGTFSSGVIADSYGTEAGAGKAGNVDIQAGRIQLSSKAKVSSDTSGGGKAGNIDIQAGQIELKEEAQIRSITSGTGDGGQINIISDGAFSASGYNSGVFANSNSTKSDAGKAGNIDIQAGQVQLKDSAQINSLTRGAGAGGTVRIRAGESFEASGYVTNEQGIFFSGISAGAYSMEAGAGNAGDIDIQAGQIQLSNKAKVGSNTSGTGNAGNIAMQTEELQLTGEAQINSSTTGTGNSGMISVRVSESFSASGYNSGVFANSNSTKSDAGKAGNIDIQAGQVYIRN